VTGRPCSSISYMESFLALHCMETEDCEQNKDEICSIYDFP
jgi:hypothetical protein